MNVKGLVNVNTICRNEQMRHIQRFLIILCVIGEVELVDISVITHSCTNKLKLLNALNNHSRNKIARLGDKSVSFLSS